MKIKFIAITLLSLGLFFLIVIPALAEDIDINDLVSMFHTQTSPNDGNTIFLPQDCSAYGMWDESVSTCTLTQDLFESVEIIVDNITLDCNGHKITGTGTDYGILLHLRTGITVKNCIVSNFAVGLGSSESSSNINIINNTFSNNDLFGLDLMEVSNSNIAGNQISNNNWVGIYLWPTIGPMSPSNNRITENIISNSEYGIVLEFSLDNFIYHNNFIDNSNQAFVVEGVGNLFDNNYPDGGNYWSDYIGVDQYSGPNQDELGSDGIGDTPYAFTGGEDRYPFMEESGWEAPPLPTYNIAVILAESANVPHTSDPGVYQPCKLFPEKTYPNGRSKEYFEDLVYCVADYHKENSFETINLDFTIYDNDGQWFRTSKNKEDYLKKYEFITEAIDLVTDTGVDLSDKEIIIVVESKTKGKAYHIVRIDETTGQVVDFSKIIIGENDPAGVWAHEIGHFIGAYLTPQNTATPDLYNMGNVGKWDLMAEGNWNGDSLDVLFLPGNGTNPCYMSSFTKEFLQWLDYDIYPKSAYGEYWINSLDTSELEDHVFRYNLSEDVNDDSPKYYILEARNRNLKTWDSSLPGLPVIQDKNLVLYYVNSKSLSRYGYNLDKEKMTIEDWIVGIPSYDPANLLTSIIDGVLNPLGETYRDFDNLVKFSLIDDRTINDRYEIQTKIEEITYDSFGDKFWGVILRPKAFLKEKIKGHFIFEAPLYISKSYAVESASGKMRLGELSFNEGGNKENNEDGKLLSLSASSPYPKEFFLNLAKFILLSALIPLLLLNSFFILLNKVISNRELKNAKKLIGASMIVVFIFIVCFGWLFLGAGAWFMLIPLFLTIFFLVWLNIRIFRSDRLEKIIKLLRLPIKILWIIIVIMLVGAISLFIISFTQESEKEHKGIEIIIETSPLELPAFPDLDLHLYTDDGRHIGMNYETGEYEIQIEEAIVSGENQNMPEWIFIPPDVTNYHFVVSSYDNQKFLEENPEIAQEIEDTTDSYEVYARYIDPETAIYTSTIISEDIEIGVELEQPITGTVDITVLPAIPWITPKSLKEISAINLEVAKTNDKKIDKEIDKIIKHIQKSLDDKFWIDASHLDPKHGKKVFHEEHAALKKIPAELKETFKEVISKLVKADEILVKAAIGDAKLTSVQDPKNQKKVDYEIEKAEKELAKAYKDLEEDKPDRAIKRFEKAWKHAQLAIKFAKLNN